MPGATDAPAFRILPPVAFAVPLGLGLAATWWLGDPVRFGPWARWTGWALLALVVPWDAWALATLGRHHTTVLPGRPTTHLVTTGPFRLSRNPLYVGFALLSTSIALLAHSTWALAGLPVALLAVQWGAILPEETYLAGKFGDAYAQYKARVRRWL